MRPERGLPGVVYLVGAGPGDPGLITVRGLSCLRAADVLIHDRLVHPQLLDEARPGAERIFVGKEPGRPHIQQDRINALMIHRARAGLVVTRLKGGDPFIFGRGGEEAAALTAAGIQWEVVPGVTSAIGVPSWRKRSGSGPIGPSPVQAGGGGQKSSPVTPRHDHYPLSNNNLQSPCGPSASLVPSAA